jgi:Uncharacterized protein conserved in bacteria
MKLSEEPDNKPVITTRYVMDANSEITYVVCDEDGDWQFFGDEDFHESDACVVSVGQILQIDETLHYLNLKPGQTAERSDIDTSWQTVKFKRDNLLTEEGDEMEAF